MITEEEGRLPMLDLVLYRRKDVGINTKIFRKPTHTERYLPFKTHHPSSMRRSVVKSLTHRLNYISSDLKEEKGRELNYVKDVLIEEGKRAGVVYKMKCGT